MMNERIKSLTRKTLVLFCLTLVSSTAYAQRATLLGTVIDEKSGEALPGANVVVKSVHVNTGAATGMDGSFELGNLPPGTYVIITTYIGYEKTVLTDIEISSERPRLLEIALKPTGITFNPVTVTVTRRPEKQLEAPADVIVLRGEEIEARPVLTAAEHLKSVAAVDVLSSGLSSANVVIRGFNNVFSTKLLSLVDNRIARVPSLRLNAYQFIPTNLNEDIESVEIVLGPGSALYGPNSAGGVMHILTRSPISSPGTSVSLGVGERSLFMETFRHARKISEKVGFKISGQFYRGHDWEFDDPAEPDTVVKGFQTGSGRIPIAGRTPNERDFDVEKIATEGALEVRPNEDTKLVINGGFNIGSNIELTSLGAAQAIDWSYSYVQTRVNYKNLFAQAFINASDAGDTFLLRTGDLVIDNSMVYAGQLRHHMDVSYWQRFTYGLDALLTRPDSDHSLYGRNEQDDDINEIGAYLQAETEIMPNVKIVGTARLDHHNRLNDLIISPRAALVIRPVPTSHFRLTYNRAFSTPSVTNLFLDILAQRDAFGLGDDFAVDIRLQGVPENGFHFRRSENGLPQFRSSLASLAGLAKSDYIPLHDPSFTNVMWNVGRNAVLAGFVPQLQAQLQTQGLSPEQVGAISQAFVDLVPEQIRDVNHAMRILDPSNPGNPQFTSVPNVLDVQPLKATITQTFELGYKGIVGNKMALGIDVYHTQVKNFIGSAKIETPNVFLEGSSLTGFLQRHFQEALGDPRNAWLKPVLADFDKPENGGNGNGQLNDELAALFVSGTDNNGAAFIPFGTVSPEEAFDPTALILTNRNFGDISLNGVDVHFVYYMNRHWNLSGNYSFYSKNFFKKSATHSQDISLNAPKHKFGVSLNYRNQQAGVDGNLRLRFVDGFRITSGVYLGEVNRYAVFELNLGYDLPFAADTRLTLAVQNLTNNKHREVVGAAEIGRLAILRVTQSF